MSWRLYLEALSEENMMKQGFVVYMEWREGGLLKALPLCPVKEQ